MRSTILFLTLALTGLAAGAAPAAQKLPAEFDHDRIFLVVQAPDGSTLRICTDSGGGGTRVGRSTAERLKLAPAGQIKDGGRTMSLVEFPRFLAKAGVPPPNKRRGGFGARAWVVDDTAMETGGDMFLGANWYSDHVWQIDYPRRELSLLHGFRPDAQDREIPVGFVNDARGRRALDYPRITIGVDGQPIDVLLDTGALFTTSETSAPTFDVKPGDRVAGSFIAKALFDQWHARHPDWKVIEQGDSIHGHAFPLIEVPAVEVAGQTVGPVWFAERDDKVWSREGMMGPLMDEEIHGAFGGSGLHYFRVVVDYPRGKAWFRAAPRQTASN